MTTALASFRRCAGPVLFFLGGLLSLRVHAASLTELWSARVKSVVAIEYYTETESDRRPTIAYGTVIDRQGTIVLPPSAVDARVPPKQLEQFKVYLPGNPAGFAGTYLGQDVFTGLHYVRAEAKLADQLVPVTAWAVAGSPPAAMADEVWGIGLRNKEEDFEPYILVSHVAIVQALPQRTAIAQQEVAGPGLPVFNRAGAFVGLAASSFGQTYLEFSRMERSGTPIMLVDLEESSAFTLAAEVLPYLDRIPKNVYGRPLAWLGAYGLEPMDRDVANFLRLSSQSGAVVSEVLEDSPAEKAGMKDHDIIIAIDGKALPRFRPDRVVTDYVEREIERRRPGQVMALTVLRGPERVELKARLGEEPKLIREAERKYFDRLGFTVREFVYGDAVARRIKTSEGSGVVVSFVKPNGPTAIAGVGPEDWIKEIDGVPIKAFPEAVMKLSSIEADPSRNEFVLLVSHGSDTSILRIKLK